MANKTPGYEQAVSLHSSLPTYMASSGAITAGSAPTDVFSITGAAGITVKILKLWFSTEQTTAGANFWQVIKRSGANTGGTHAGVTAVPVSSADAAASAAVLTYTANPSALGTTVGNVWSGYVNAPAPATATQSGDLLTVVDFEKLLGKPLELRSASEVLALNFNGASLPTGLAFVAGIEWTEELT